MNYIIKFIFLLICVIGTVHAQVAWNANNFYQRGSVVIDNGVVYVALLRNMNKQPKVSTQFWIPRSSYNSNMQTVTVVNETTTPIGFSSDLNFGIDKGASSLEPQLESWSSAKAYTKGKLVTFDGAIWRANYWCQGEPPGSSEAWSPTVTTKWTPHVAYIKGQSAIYNDITYTAQWWTKGDVPYNDKTGVWLLAGVSSANLASTKNYQNQSVESTVQPLQNYQTNVQNTQWVSVDNNLNPTSYPAWRADIKYSNNSLVSFSDAVWRKNGDLDNRRGPTEDNQWVPITRTKWYSNVIYQKGMTATYNGSIWYAQWYNVNIFPPNDITGVWIEIDTNGNRVFTSDKSEYLLSRVYVKGDKCMYNGHAWLSMYWNQGEAPGSSMAWVPLTVTKWYSNVPYDPKDLNNYRYHVIYNGIEWKALYWTKGDIPSKSAAWKPLVLTDWISAFAYNKNDEVIYDGAKWQAKWWNQGETPLNSDAWEPLTVSNWSAQRAYVGGNQVYYNGFTWLALWWVKGELPGASSAWKKM